MGKAVVAWWRVLGVKERTLYVALAVLAPFAYGSLVLVWRRPDVAGDVVSLAMIMATAVTTLAGSTQVTRAWTDVAAQKAGAPRAGASSESEAAP